MGYQQGTGDLQRSKTTAAVTLGSSNGDASVSCEGTRVSLSVTLNGDMAMLAVSGNITLSNDSIKATSVIESCAQSNNAFSAFDVFDVQDGSCQLSFTNYTPSPDPITGNPTAIFSIMIYN
jgi:hypothetical protein